MCIDDVKVVSFGKILWHFGKLEIVVKWTRVYATWSL